MATQIKITQLTNIGSANLVGTTLLPVVNMAGVPTTQKTTLGNLANVILSQSGGNYAAVGTANIAYSVANAAQPNITSVGTLTNVVVSGNATVNGNITSNGTAYVGNLSTTGDASITTLSVGATANLGAVANVRITGGTNGYVLSTNGSGNLSWVAQSGGGGNGVPGGTNTQVQFNDANSFAGNTGFTFNKTTGIFSSPFLAGNGNGLSNIQGANVSGFVANANIANTAFAVAGANVSGTVANANLSQYLNVSDVNNNFSYHIVLSAGSGDKSLHIDADDNLQYNPSDGTLTATRVDATYVLADLQFSNGYPAANVTGLGNIATINLTGSNSNVLYGNGVFAAVTVGNLSQISNGNSNVTLTDTNGNVYINVNGGTQKQWIFDTAGNLRTPGNVDIYGAINFPQQVSSINWSTYNIELSQYGRINTNVDFFANANTIGALYLKGDGSNISNITRANVSGLGNISTINLDGNVSNLLTGNGTYVTIPTVPTVGNIATLNLDGSNTNVLYGNGVFAAVAGGNANTGNVTFSDQVVMGTGSNDGTGGLYLAPGNASIANSAVQYLRVRGGDVVTHIHLDTGNNAFYDQYFGADSRYVKLEANGNIVINADDYNGNAGTWTFDTTGNLTLPGNLVIAGNANVFGTNSSLLQTTDNRPLIALSSGANGAVSSLWVEDIGNVGTSNIAAVYANPTVGSKIVRIAVGQNGGGGPNLWDFGTTGNLTLPTSGHIIVSGGLVSSGASPAPSINGFSITNSVGISGNGNIAGNNISATGNISANNFTGNGGTLSNVATKVEGSWTLASGNNTVSINVPLNGTYTLWVNGNIPNGIVTYTATAVVTNTNVPVLGEQYAWYYAVGNALVFTSIPDQFTGTVGSISNVNTYLGNTANVFTFGITNNSGNTAVVNYGYTKL
jgi:hypothetical protein